MIVSHNELVAAVNKAFLGLRRCCGEADVVANMVADLQIVGLNGVGHFNKALAFLGSEKDIPVTITQPKLGHLIVDLQGGSLACHLPNIIDYAVELLVHTKPLTITIRNCHNRWLAYSELVKLSAKGLACKAQWANGSDSKQTLYILNKGCVYPELFQSTKAPVEPQGSHDMIIELAVTNFALPALTSAGGVHFDASTLRETQEFSWKNGIVVDDAEWKKLKQAATVFLVENSETSSKGAGELVVE
ncbi:DUF3726 domain-containing protein [Photobacterium minamisatsumaniensis]|uniref:DUF3726 domain-containing protein n=1 Tax=Photobacterium minamisatsumaniensis TaxID=2910233 RepID=UPI003D12164D